MLTYMPALTCFNQIQHIEMLQWPRTSDLSGSLLSRRDGMACGNGIVSRYGSDQTSQKTTASLRAGLYMSSNATPSQVRCHDSKLASSYRASKCSKTSTTMTLSAPYRAVQPLGTSSPLLLQRIWNFTALTLHRHSFRQIACHRASMADSSTRPLQALHTPIPLVLCMKCSDPSMVSPPARAPYTKNLIVTSNVQGSRTPGSKNLWCAAR